MDLKRSTYYEINEYVNNVWEATGRVQSLDPFWDMRSKQLYLSLLYLAKKGWSRRRSESSVDLFIKKAYEGMLRNDYSLLQEARMEISNCQETEPARIMARQWIAIEDMDILYELSCIQRRIDVYNRRRRNRKRRERKTA